MSSTHVQARLAAACRYNPDVDHSDLRRELRTEQAAEYIQKLVAAAPPLTQAQKDRLASLLRGAAA